MSDFGIKKSRVRYADLPPINGEIGGYQLRYRIVSEDKNRTSHWSQLHEVIPGFTYVSGSGDIHITSTNNITAEISWDNVKVNKIVSDVTNFIANQDKFDIFIKWSKNNQGDWLYSGEVLGKSLSVLIPNSYVYNENSISVKPNQLSAKIFIKSSMPNIANTDLLVYSIDYHSV